MFSKVCYSVPAVLPSRTFLIKSYHKNARFTSDKYIDKKRPVYYGYDINIFKKGEESYEKETF